MCIKWLWCCVHSIACMKNNFEPHLNLKLIEIHKNHTFKNQKSKIQKVFNFGKVKCGKMGNFSRIPNIKFSKFYLFKKALKFLFFSLFLMEKDLNARNLRNPGGFPENCLFFFLPFLSSPARKQPACFTAADATSRPPPCVDNDPDAVPCPLSLLSPRSLLSLPQNPEAPEASPPPRSVAAGARQLPSPF